MTFLVAIAWMARSIPKKVDFDLGNRSIQAKYLFRPSRSFYMDEIRSIEWRVNMYAKQPALWLQFSDGQRLIVPPATHDSRINAIVAEMRRMIPG